jgi:hypothetical protein
VFLLAERDGRTLDDEASVNDRDEREDAEKVAQLNDVGGVIEYHRVNSAKARERPVATGNRSAKSYQHKREFRLPRLNGQIRKDSLC